MEKPESEMTAQEIRIKARHGKRLNCPSRQSKRGLPKPAKQSGCLIWQGAGEGLSQYRIAIGVTPSHPPAGSGGGYMNVPSWLLPPLRKTYTSVGAFVMLQKRCSQDWNVDPRGFWRRSSFVSMRKRPASLGPTSASIASFEVAW